MTKLFTLESLNSLPFPAFSGAIGDVFEHASWVADAVFGYRSPPCTRR
jgi:2-oxo-4-hydroxy-4-carboxy--5-ureidoimidazoline (OHCU) decarboxylase